MSGTSESIGESVIDDLPRRVLDNLREGCQVIAPDYRYLYVNDAVVLQGRTTRDQLVGRTMMDAYPGIEHTPMFALLRRCMEERTPQHMENEFTFPDGATGWFELRFEPVPGGVFILSMDITQRKLAERALRQANQALVAAEQDLATTLQSIGDAVIATDERGNVVRMNPVAETLTGWSLAEARGRHLSAIFNIVNENTRSIVENPVERVLREGVVVGLANHTLLISRDGSERPIADSGAPIRDATGTVRGVVLVFRDVTETHKAEHELRRSEELLRTMLEAAPDAMLITDTAGLIVSVNARTREILGYESDELVGKSVDMLVPRDLRDGHGAHRSTYLSRPTTRPMGISREVLAEHKSGKLIPVEISLAILNTSKGTLVMSALRDVSARKALEQQHQQMQRMESVGRLAGGIAHDFNNLLSVILSYSSTLVDELRENDPMRDDLAQIHEAGQRAAVLTRQLLAFSRKQVMQPEVVDLNSLIADMSRLLRRIIGEDIELSMMLKSELHLVKVDRSQFEQVLMNLVVNAKDAMPTGGQLTIEAANVHLDEDYAQRHVGVTPGAHVMLAVSDTGSGMSKEVQARLFEPFFTTKELGKGTGLGLSTTFGIVKQSGGHLWVYSEVGRGTTFRVYLPATTETEIDVVPDAPKATVLRGTETVLLVEDDPMVRGLAKGILQRNGYKILEASNGGEALLLCEQHRDAIDLLLTDVVMPRMSGRELTDRLRVICPRMKVLFMSGYTENAIVHHGVLDSGVNFLQKPLTPDALLRKLREILQ